MTNVSRPVAACRRFELISILRSGGTLFRNTVEANRLDSVQTDRGRGLRGLLARSK